MKFTSGEQAFILWFHWKSGAFERLPSGSSTIRGIYGFKIKGPVQQNEVVVFRPSDESFYPESMSQIGDVKIGFAFGKTYSNGLSPVGVMVPYSDVVPGDN